MGILCRSYSFLSGASFFELVFLLMYLYASFSSVVRIKGVCIYAILKCEMAYRYHYRYEAVSIDIVGFACAVIVPVLQRYQLNLGERKSAKKERHPVASISISNVASWILS